MATTKNAKSMCETMEKAWSANCSCGGGKSMSEMMKKFCKSGDDTSGCEEMMKTICGSMFKKSDN